MINFGEVPAGAILPIMFATYGKTNGESITLTGLAVTDIEIYKNGSITQRASDAGYTLLDTDGIDFDLLTGIHGFSIDLGDNTDAGFFAVGSFYTVVVSAVTIDSQTVNFIAATFRIKAAEAIAGKAKVDVDAWLGTAAATPTVNGVPEVDLTHVAGATTDVSGLATNAAAIKTKTDNLPSDPADQSLVIAATDALATLISDVPTNAELATALGTADDAVLTAIGDLPTNAELATALAAADDAVLAQVALVKTQTDKLTFTVANVLNANITHVNEIEVSGDGQSGTEWGPA